MKIKNIRLKWQWVYLFVLLLFAKNGFYIWQDNDYLIDQVFKYSDFGLILALVFFIVVAANYRIKLGAGKYDKYVIMYVMLTFVSAFAAYGFFGQSIVRGIFAQRVQLFWIITYFPLRRLFQKRIITVEWLYKLILYLVVFELSLCTLQFVVGKEYLFLNVMLGSRGNITRYYYNISLMLIVAFQSLQEALSKKHSFRNYLITLWIGVVIVFFAQYRSIFVYYLIGCVFVILLWNRDIGKRIILIGLGIILVAFIINRSETGKLIADTFSNGVFNDANMQVRNYARLHYLKGWTESPLSFILGKGYPSVSNVQAFAAAGYYNYMYFSDNGIFGLLYCYGLIGLVWYLLFWGKLLSDSWKHKSINSSYCAYIIYFIVGFINDFSWFWAGMFPFIINITLLEFDNPHSTRKVTQ